MRKTITFVLALSVLAAACAGSYQTTEAAATIAATATSAVAATTTTTTTTTTETAVAVTGTAGSESVVAASVEDGCPDEHFLLDEVNSFVHTDGTSDPELAVTCTSDTLIVTGNGIINYEFVQMTPNDIAAQNAVYEIPLDPIEADDPGALGLGTVGVAVNGVAIFGAFEAPFDGYQDPYLDGLLDYCNGHTAPGGVYHYHASFSCIFDDPTLVGLVFGYLFDGYEIVSPWVCADDACAETIELVSSYVRVDESSLGAFTAWEYVEGSGDLDVCNGAVGADGEYRYYLTREFPYVPFCYHGETDAAVGTFAGDAPAGGRP